MPTPNLTAAAVDALARRAEQATGVDGINVDKDVLAALIEGWRCWQMVEAMPAQSALVHDTWWEAFASVHAVNVGYSGVVLIAEHSVEGPPQRLDPAAALTAAFAEEGSDGE